MKVSSFQPMQSFDVAKHVAAEKPAQQTKQQHGAAPAAVISQEELQFFTTMYPERSKDLSTYSTYSQRGVSPEPSIGSMIDKKS